MIRQRVSFAVAGVFVASSVLTVGLASSASAVDTQYDPDFVPAAGDLVGVGSDTIEIALDHLSKGIPGTTGFNNTGTPAFKIASFAAAGTPATVTLRAGATAIPRTTINGSGSGKAKLYGTGNNLDVSFARSSSSLNQAEVTAGLQQFPFAVDGLKLAVSGATSSHAPATITPADMVKIYSGQVTNWSQLGGTSGVIKPYVPPTTSGTYSFFIAQLKAANSGADVSLAGSVATSQEHDDTLIKSDPDAIAPFSTARAKGLTSTIKLEKGFKAYRAVYNVVRGGDIATTTPGTIGAKLTSVFGAGGFVCSPAAKPLIEAAGFDQLASQSSGGVCGEATSAATSNFKTTGQIDTETTLTAETLNDNKVKLTAKVDASTPAAGSVQFTSGETALGDPVEVNGSGVATKTLTLVPTGSYSYKAEFTPDSLGAFTPSSDAKTLDVKTSSQVTVALLNATGTYGSTRLAAFSATVDGEPATGSLKVVVDNGAPVTVPLIGGAAFYTVPGTSSLGSHTITATLPEGATSNADSSSAGFTVTKATTKASFKFADATIKAKTTPKATATVVINGAASSIKPSGKITLRYGSKIVGTGTVTNGVAKVTLKKFKKKSSAYSVKATFTSTNANYSSSPASAAVKIKVS